MRRFNAPWLKHFEGVLATPADPMLRRIEPCVATLVDKPPKGPEWAFEVKWDGYRLAVHVEPEEVRAITRGGYDWTKKFGSIVAEAREARPRFHDH